MTTRVLPEGWSVEGPDESVGIFGDAYCHEVCTKEYDKGVDEIEIADLSSPGVDDQGYVSVLTRLECLDCGAHTEYQNKFFVGKDEWFE